MSQNRAHLTPTVITDKNGKLTTVHKKPVTGTGSAGRIPHVTMPTTGTDRAQLEREVADALIDTGTSYADTLRNSYLEALHRYKDNTLQRLIAVAPALKANASITHTLLILKPDDRFLNDWVTINSITLGESLDSQNIIRGLSQYENLSPQQDDDYPPRRTEEVLAIARVSAHLSGLGNGLEYDTDDNYPQMEYIADPQLRSFITTHQNPAAVADIITSRGITDVGQIAEIYDTMRNTHSAIREGTL